MIGPNPSTICGAPRPKGKGLLKARLTKWLQAHMEDGACVSCYYGYLQPYLVRKDQISLEAVSRDCKCDVKPPNHETSTCNCERGCSLRIVDI